MLSEFLVLLRTPVTGMKESAGEKNVKKEAIIAAVLAVIIAFVTILSTYLGVVKLVNKTYKSLDDYNDKYSWREDITKSEFKKMKKEAKETALDSIEFGEVFFKTLAYYLIAVLVITGILFVTARIIQSPMDFIESLAMTNRAFVIYTIGFLLNMVLSMIYVPVGIIIFLVSIVYAVISLATAFKETLNVADSDKYAMISTIVIGIVIAVLVFIINSKIGSVMNLLF